MIENILSPTRLLLILAVALIMLGPKRRSEAGRGLGSAIRGVKRSLSAPERREEQPAIQPSREHDHTGRRRIARSRRRCCTPRSSLSDHRSLDRGRGA